MEKQARRIQETQAPTLHVRVACQFSPVLALASITTSTYPHSKENKKFRPSLGEKQGWEEDECQSLIQIQVIIGLGVMKFTVFCSQ